MIDTSIPAPRKRGRPPKWPFAKLDVGHSFRGDVSVLALRHAAWRAHVSLPGRRFIVREEGTGARCWRIA